MRWFPTTALIAWAVFLVGVLLHPLLAPGEFATRDMVVLDSPALSPGAVGLGHLPPRNVPQDGILVLAGMLIDASILTRLLILAAGLTAAFGAWWLVSVIRKRTGAPPSAWAIAAGMTIAVWNPWVVERLLQGHWSLVIAGWLLPAIAAAGLSGRLWAQLGLIFPATLTPTGAIFALITGVFTARTWHDRGSISVVFLIASLPWIVPGMIAGESGTSSMASVHVFAPRAETFASTAGSLLGLGGIWNSQAVPYSRQVGFALVGIVLAIILATAYKRLPAVLWWVAGIGFAIPVTAWLLPELLGLITAHVPGGGLLRDSTKFLALALPAYVGLAGLLSPKPAATALALSLLQVPDAPYALQEIRPVELHQDYSEIAERAGHRDVFFPERHTLVLREDGIVTVDPATKALSVVESGALSVDGITTDPVHPRYRAATEAWQAGDIDRLKRLDIGLVVTEDGQITDTGLEPPERGSWFVAAAWWPLTGLILGLVILRAKTRNAGRYRAK